MPITSLNENDVLIGRGTGPNAYIGNKRFRQHVDTRREEYVNSKTNKEKTRIAQEVVDHIHSLGGRFVIQVLKGEKVGDLLVGGEWREGDSSVVIEKAKQSLRQRKEKKPSGATTKKEGGTTVNERIVLSTKVTSLGSDGVDAVSPPLEGESIATIQDNLAPWTSPILNRPNPITSSWNPLAASPMSLGNTQYPDVDARLLFFQSAVGSLQPSQPLPATSSALQHIEHLSPSTAASSGPSQTVLLEEYAAATRHQQRDVGLCSLSSEPLHQTASKKHQRTEDSKVAKHENTTDGGIHEESPTETTPFLNELYSASEVASKEDEAAAFIMSSLAIKDRPVVTNEQMEQEKASMSDEQRASALADLFGEMHVGDDTAPSSKKAKRDLDQESIDFLLLQMRFEIEKIPERKKQSLIEARAKCRAEEFSNARLEKFLRCEEMNTELAAQRFVGYWEKRKEAFGKDKFTLPLTLSEALRDDITALEVAVYGLLPRRDLSGRQIMYLVPSHNTGVGYSPDSLFRAMWYVAEVAAAQNTDTRSGVVEVTWHKGCSLWDYDPKIYDRLVESLRRYWPIRTIAAHICCPSKIFVRCLFPILNFFAGPALRSRLQVHDVPENEIADALSAYGIQREMLPTEMGGTVELNPTEWIAQRRAAEMEEP